jgi:mannose-1-phosphate guanylyltransferase
MESMTPSPIWALILAGGDGRRLGTLTRNVQGVSTPKQYCSLNGGPSLLRLSIKRALRLVPAERIVVVVAEQHRRWWTRELAGFPHSNVVVQPTNRGTGVGILLPLLMMENMAPKATVMCLPSDHYIEDEEVLSESLLQASARAKVDCDKLTLLGIRPTAPDTGLGYLSALAGKESEIRPLLGFYEKPDREYAARLIQQGSVWNSGIVVGLLQAFLHLYSRHAPGLLRNLKPITKRWPDPQVPSPDLLNFYASHADVDFSRDILQRQPARLQMLMVPPCGWNDIGTPARLASTPTQSHDNLAPDLQASPFNLAAAFSTALAGRRSLSSLEALQSD